MEIVQQVWQYVLAAVVAGLVAAWGWARTHKDDIADAASWVIGIVQRYKAGEPEPALEDYAVTTFFELFPELVKRKQLTEFGIRLAIRDACRRRREAADKAGLRKAAAQ